jgi:hypothetical protein
MTMNAAMFSTMAYQIKMIERTKRRVASAGVEPVTAPLGNGQVISVRRVRLPMRGGCG